MKIAKQISLPLRSQDHVVLVRQAVRNWAVEIGMNLVDQTKVVTAASEIGRNTVIHGGGGTVLLERVESGSRRGLRLTFEDEGAGIPDIDRAMKDGFSTGEGLGLGLGGAKRLSNEFAISSEPGKGTRVTLTKWKE